MRRFKIKLHKDSGDTALKIFQEHVASYLLDDILGFNEMIRQCWKIIKSSTDNIEKIKAMSMLRLVIAEKLRILKSYPSYGLMSSSQCDHALPREFVNYMPQDHAMIDIGYTVKNLGAN